MNHFLKIFLICSLLGCPALTVLGQSKKELKKEKKEAKKLKNWQKKLNREHYTIQGTGLGYSRFQDLQMANRIYGGPSISLTFGDLIINPNGRHEFIYLKANAALAQPSSVQMYMLETRYSYTRNIAKWGVNNQNIIRFGGYIGAFANFRFHPSLSNSGFYVDGMPQIGPSADIQMPFTFPLIKKRARFVWKLESPLFSLLIRLPEYGLSGFGGPTDYAMPVGRQGRLISRVGFVVPFSKNNRNLIRLGYDYDLYGYNESDIFRTRVAQHQFDFTLLLNLTPSENEK